MQGGHSATTVKVKEIFSILIDQATIPAMKLAKVKHDGQNGSSILAAVMDSSTNTTYKSDPLETHLVECC